MSGARTLAAFGRWTLQSLSSTALAQHGKLGARRQTKTSILDEGLVVMWHSSAITMVEALGPLSVHGRY